MADDAKPSVNSFPLSTLRLSKENGSGGSIGPDMEKPYGSHQAVGNSNMLGKSMVTPAQNTRRTDQLQVFMDTPPQSPSLLPSAAPAGIFVPSFLPPSPPETPPPPLGVVRSTAPDTGWAALQELAADAHQPEAGVANRQDPEALSPSPLRKRSVLCASKKWGRAVAYSVALATVTGTILSVFSMLYFQFRSDGLARWTATKDFIEYCQGLSNPDCEAVRNKGLKAPPWFSDDFASHAQRRSQLPGRTSGILMQEIITGEGRPGPAADAPGLWLPVALVAMLFALLVRRRASAFPEAGSSGLAGASRGRSRSPGSSSPSSSSSSAHDAPGLASAADPAPAATASSRCSTPESLVSERFWPTTDKGAATGKAPAMELRRSKAA